MGLPGPCDGHIWEPIYMEPSATDKDSNS